MRGVLSALFLMVFIYVQVDAAPYIIGEYNYVQPNGIPFSVQKNGDEFGIYECSNNGLVAKNEIDGYYYYGILNEQGRTVLSNVKVGIDEERCKFSIKSIQSQNWSNWKQLSVANKLKQGVAKIATVSIPDSLIVLLVQFSDVKHKGGITKTQFWNYFFREGYSSPS